MEEKNPPLRSTQTYLDVLSMDQLVFLSYLEQFKTDVVCNLDDPEAMRDAGNKLPTIANIISMLSSLLSYAKVRKRQLARTGSNTDYQDMVDKESAIELTIQSVDTQYKALSKVLTAAIELNREQYLSESVRDPYANKSTRRR